MKKKLLSYLIRNKNKYKKVKKKYNDSGANESEIKIITRV